MHHNTPHASVPNFILIGIPIPSPMRSKKNAKNCQKRDIYQTMEFEGFRIHPVPDKG